MKTLTEKQKNILDFIEDFLEREGMAPTVYEIADNFDIKTSTVFAHLRALQRKKQLSRSSKASWLPVEAPLGTAAEPAAPSCKTTSACTVGKPRESKISLAFTAFIFIRLPPVKDGFNLPIKTVLSFGLPL